MKMDRGVGTADRDAGTAEAGSEIEGGACGGGPPVELA